MFCGKCGKEVADGAAFCPDCGASLASAPAPAPAAEPAPAPAPAPAPVKVKTPPVGGPLEPARGNILFFVAVICFSVVVGFQLLSSLSSLISSPLAGLIELVAAAIPAVILAGLWLCWASGLDGSKAHLMTLGLKMIGIGVLIQLIAGAVAFGLIDLLVLILAVAGGIFMDSWEIQRALYQAGLGGLGGAYTGLMLVIFLFLAAFTALFIIYYVKLMKTVKDAQTSDETGTLTGVPSMLVVVLTFVMAGVSLLSLLFGGLFANPLSVLSNLASIGANVLFGIVMLQFRNQNTTVA